MNTEFYQVYITKLGVPYVEELQQFRDVADGAVTVARQQLTSKPDEQKGIAFITREGFGISLPQNSVDHVATVPKDRLDEFLKPYLPPEPVDFSVPVEVPVEVPEDE